MRRMPAKITKETAIMFSRLRKITFHPGKQKINIEPSKVIDAGNLASEHLEIIVNNGCNLKNYIVVDNTYDQDDKLSNKHQHIFFFPDKEVEAGDTIILMSKKGDDSSQGFLLSKTHTFHWNLSNSVWNKGRDCAMIFEICHSKFKEV
jgi:hypothetical protein